MLGDPIVLSRVVAEEPHPYQRPAESSNSENDERTTPGGPHQKPGYNGRCQRVANARKRMRNPLRKTPTRLGRPTRHGTSGGGKRGAFSESEQEAQRAEGEYARAHRREHRRYGHQD